MLTTMRFPKTKPKGKGLIPFGYVYNEDTKLLEAIPGHLETLEEALQLFLSLVLLKLTRNHEPFCALIAIRTFDTALRPY